MNYVLLVLINGNIETWSYDKLCKLVYAYYQLPKYIKAFHYYEYEGELFPLDI